MTQRTDLGQARVRCPACRRKTLADRIYQHGRHARRCTYCRARWSVQPPTPDPRTRRRAA